MKITTKKQANNPELEILKLWNEQRWIAYKELEPSISSKKKGVFKEIIFKMSSNFCYNFCLTEQEYINWRKIKPSFHQQNEIR